MNYDHAYHAGNFCDVLKHVVLVLVIEHMKKKPSPFRVIDTHAGAGAFQLDDARAARTGEAGGGIARLIGPDALPLEPRAAAVLAPYLDVVRTMNPDGGLRDYPGSPLLANRLLRHDDVLQVNELHPGDGAKLAQLFQRSRSVRVSHLDGYTALRAFLPPAERRGVLLVDPPFEQPGEFGRLSQALADATQRFGTGTTILWYPKKDARAVRLFHQAVSTIVADRLLCVELDACENSNSDMLFGNGLVIHNPPFNLVDNLRVCLPTLAKCLQIGQRGSWRVEWLKSPR